MSRGVKAIILTLVLFLLLGGYAAWRWRGLAFDDGPQPAANSDLNIINKPTSGLTQIVYRGRVVGELPTALGTYQVNTVRRTDRFAYFEHCPKEAAGYLLFGVCPRKIYRLNLNTFGFNNVLGTDSADLAEDISPDETLVAAGRAASGNQGVELQVYLKQIDGAEEKAYPVFGGFTQLGDLHFSPDGTRLAYALAIGNPGSEGGVVGMLSLTDGRNEVVASSTVPGVYYRVKGWKDNNVVQYDESRIQN